MNRSRLVGFAFGGGVVLTLLTGLFPLRTLMGATHYGFPMAWVSRRVLAPEYFPWRVHWLGLVVDLFVWTAVVFAIVFVYTRRSMGRRRTGRRDER
jgi:hypothetical protein